MAMSTADLDLHEVMVGGSPLMVAPLQARDRLVLLGQREQVAGILRAIAQLPGTAGSLRPEDDSQRITLHVRTALRTSAHTAPDAWAQAAAHFSFTVPGRRVRLGDLSPADSARLHLSLALAHALASGAAWLVLDRPFAGVSGRVRTGLRERVLAALDQFKLGLVIHTEDVVDAGVIGGEAIVIEQDQIADAGPLADQLAAPRSNFAAGFAGVNVFSALARGGWISIGHSRVKARTELDGKLLVSIPTHAVTLAVDEFDESLTSDAVFEAVIVGTHDTPRGVQVVLSPSDPEGGLALTADLFDFAAPAAHAPRELPWGLVHPGLGATLEEQRAQATMGARIFAEVDTSALRAYPTETDATVLQGKRD